MTLPKPLQTFDVDAYLEWEATQPDRHEYLAGETFAMTGARSSHNTIALNLAVILKAALRGLPCRTHIEGVKVRIDAANAVVYPDVFVTCAAHDQTPEAELFKTSPSLVVEVLSESTAAYDRGLKFELYQQIPSLQEYLLIEQDRRHVDLFRKNEQGLWVLHPLGPGDSVSLRSVTVDFTVDALYEDVSNA
jgi:Uma2 family endonuclease